MRQQTTITVEVTLTYDDDDTTEYEAQQDFLDDLPTVGTSSLWDLHYAAITDGLVDENDVPVTA